MGEDFARRGVRGGAWSLAMKSQSRKNYFVTNRPRT